MMYYMYHKEGFFLQNWGWSCSFLKSLSKAYEYTVISSISDLLSLFQDEHIDSIEDSNP